MQEFNRLEKTGFIVVLGLCWSIAFPLIKMAIEVFTPIQMVAGRFLIACVMMVAYRLITVGHVRLSKNSIVPCLMVAFVGTMPAFSFLGVGQQQVSSSEATLIIGLVPLLTLLGALYFIPHERFTALQGLGCVLSVLGVLVLVDLEKSAAPPLYYGAIFVTAICYTFINIYSRKYLKNTDSVEISYGMILFCTGGSVLLAALEGVPVPAYTFYPYISMLGLGLVSTFFATILFFFVATRVGALSVAMANNLIPIFGVLLSAAIVGEALTWTVLFSALLIMAGIYCVQRPSKHV